MKFAVKRPGLYGAKGMIPVGTEFSLKEDPKMRSGHIAPLDPRIADPEPSADAEALAAAQKENEDLKAKLAAAEAEIAEKDKAAIAVKEAVVKAPDAEKVNVTNPASGARKDPAPDPKADPAKA